MKPSNSELIFIISPPRSGSKLLRSIIAASSAVYPIPFDINPVWCHYFSLRCNSDYLPVPLTRNSHLYHSFLQKQSESTYILEKTVSNCLRFNFLLNEFPHAKFIVLYRDPLNTARSIYDCWTSPNSLPYLAAKLRYLPLPAIYSHFARVLKQKTQFARKYWGVLTPHAYKLSNDGHTLLASFQQLYDCHLAINQVLTNSPSSNIITVSYERLVCSTQQSISHIFDFLNLDIPPEIPIIYPDRNIGLQNLKPEDQYTLETLVPTLGPFLATLDEY